MEETKKILFAGGGTGGHVMPLISLYKYLQEEEASYQFLWLGERDSLEEEMAHKYEIDFYCVSAGKIRRYFDWRNFYEPLKNLTGIFESIFQILRFKPDIIFSKGGYVALPVCIAGWLLRKDVYIHESDTITGATNAICARFAKKIFYTFPKETEQNQETKQKKYIHSGPIMNPEMIDSVQSMEVEENDRLHVLVIAGSQGSTRIFTAILDILKDCKDIDFHIVLGDKNIHLKEKFLPFSHAHTYDFLKAHKLGDIMKKTDIAISRGSSTLWELMYFGIHTIIVPLKSASANHQQKNAEYFQKRYSFDILDEDKELSLEIFRKLQNYKDARKSQLQLDGFFDGIHAIEQEILNHKK